MSITLFDIIENICTKSGDMSSSPDFLANYNSFMITKYFSMIEHGLPYSNFINNKNMVYISLHEKRLHYLYYYNIISKRNKFIKYLKETKNNKEDIYISLLTPQEQKEFKKDLDNIYGGKK